MQNVADIMFKPQGGISDNQFLDLLGMISKNAGNVGLKKPILFDDYTKANITNLTEIWLQYIEELYLSDDDKMNKLLEKF